MYVCVSLCVFCPAAPQACGPDVRLLYALDKSRLSSVLGLHDPIPAITHTLFLSARAFACVCFCLFFYCSVHIVIYEPLSSVRIIVEKEKCFWLVVCVRGRLRLLCLHPFIVCTHMAGDTNALRYAGGHIRERLIVEIVLFWAVSAKVPALCKS